MKLKRLVIKFILINEGFGAADKVRRFFKITEMNITDNWEKLAKHGITKEKIKEWKLKPFYNRDGYLRGFRCKEHTSLDCFSTIEEVIMYVSTGTMTKKDYGFFERRGRRRI